MIHAIRLCAEAIGWVAIWIVAVVVGVILLNAAGWRNPDREH